MYIYIQMCAFVCVVVFLSVFIYVHFCFTFLSRYFSSFAYMYKQSHIHN